MVPSLICFSNWNIDYFDMTMRSVCILIHVAHDIPWQSFQQQDVAYNYCAAIISDFEFCLCNTLDLSFVAFKGAY